MPSLDNAELNWNGSQGMDDFPLWPASVPSVAGLQVSSGFPIAHSSPEAFRGGLTSSWPSGMESPADSRNVEGEEEGGLFGMIAALNARVDQLSGRGVGDEEESREQPWSELKFNTVESLEDYAAAAPAFDLTTLSGLRGAGGWGFGSNSNRPPSDFFDPLRRQPGFQ